MNRREFFGDALPLALIGGGYVAAVVALSGGEQYVPAGLIVAGDFQSRNVDYVTLNGQRIEDVTECDDSQGWLRHLVKIDGVFHFDPATRGQSERPLRTAYRTGVVRIHWRSA